MYFERKYQLYGIYRERCLADDPLLAFIEITIFSRVKLIARFRNVYNLIGNVGDIGIFLSNTFFSNITRYFEYFDFASFLKYIFCTFSTRIRYILNIHNVMCILSVPVIPYRYSCCMHVVVYTDKNNYLILQLRRNSRTLFTREERHVWAARNRQKKKRNGVLPKLNS